jgi:Xaa-Pro aminopeptidase
MTEKLFDASDGMTLLDGRIMRLREVARANNLDAVVVSHLSNLFYLTHLRTSAGVLVVDVNDDSLRFLLDFRYQTAATARIRERCGPSGLEVIPVTGSYEEAVAAVLNSTSVTRVGLEADHTSVRQWQWLDRHAHVSLVPLVDLVERLRMIKDEGEVAILRRAGRLLSEIVPDIMALAARKRPEVEIAREIDQLVLEAGFERTAFETIVASGPNSALPHAHPTARKLSDGDLVILDFGGVLDGYCVDISRTVVVGIADAECKRLYSAVQEAQRAAIDKVIPGESAEQVDAAARDVLDSYGLGEAFGHSTGHGLGLDVHELPRVGRKQASAEPVMLESGMVFTIEPGVYVPGLGGVRIEDDVLVTSSGVERLTYSAGELMGT